MNPQYLARPNGHKLAYHSLAGRGPTIVFLPGFRSDMTGSKATRLWQLAQARGQACVLFDYRGHGQSSDRFENGTIGDWASDAVAIIDEVTQGPLLLVGSSMGGWIMLLAAIARPERVMGMIGIAAAPDFTERLIRPDLSAGDIAALERDGQILLPSEYGEPTPLTKKLLDEGRDQLVMDGPIKLTCPVYLLHGQADPDVPWQTSIDLAANLESSGVTVELIKDGDHRLSREADLGRLESLVVRMLTDHPVAAN